MGNIWILSANSSQATIFSAESQVAQPVAIATMENPAARIKPMDLVSDRPGRTFDSFGGQRHAKSSEVDPREQEQIRFAKLIVERLERGRLEGEFDRLVVAAGPEFLGELRTHFGAPLKALIAHEIDKDYTALKPAELRSRLPAQL